MSVPSEFQRLLYQWSRWVRQTMPFHHCGSVEHKYLSPQCWNEPEPRPPEINTREALAAEHAILGLPDKHRAVFVYRHVHRVKEPHIMARLIRRRYRVAENTRGRIWIRPQDMADLLHDAEAMVRNRLKRAGLNI